MDYITAKSCKDVHTFVMAYCHLQKLEVSARNPCSNAQAVFDLITLGKVWGIPFDPETVKWDLARFCEFLALWGQLEYFRQE